MSVVLVAFKYRICPKPRQERLLKSHLSSLCRLYNDLRDLKINKLRNERASFSENDLRLTALEMRRNNESLKEIHSQVVQNVATRYQRHLITTSIKERGSRSTRRRINTDHSHTHSQDLDCVAVSSRRAEGPS